VLATSRTAPTKLEVIDLIEKSPSQSRVDGTGKVMMLRETSALFQSSQYDLTMIDGASGALPRARAVHPRFWKDMLKLLVI
jgi:hypothetical protein